MHKAVRGVSQRSSGGEEEGLPRSVHHFTHTFPVFDVFSAAGSVVRGSALLVGSIKGLQRI